MQTVLRVKYNELNINFLQAIKTLFKSTDELEIIVNPTSGNTQKVTPNKYWAKIDKAIADVKKGNVISMTMDEFEKYTGK